MASIPVIESEVDFHVEGAGKPCKTWYTIFGTFPSPTGVRPLVCLHGGPGVPHYFLRPIQNLYTTHNIPVIMYDQVGCGRSTLLPEKKGNESFWTVKLFLLELDNLLAHPGIEGDYNLFGQSWGGSLASEHAVLQPNGLKKLIIANSPASKRHWLEASEKLRAQLPEDINKALTEHEAAGTLTDPAYQKAKMFYLSRHMCRVSPLPGVLLATMQALAKDSTVNTTMNRPYLFKRTGTLQNWSIENDIHKIIVPTLLINGKYDGAQDSAMEPFFNLIDKVKWVRFGESSHMPHLEEPDEFLQVVGGFLSL